MSSEEQDVELGKILLKFKRSEQRLAVLKHKASEIATDLNVCASQLRDSPENIHFSDDGLALKDYKNIGDLVQDIKSTVAELQNLAATLEKAGIPYKN
jgi:hypothetical protein